MRHLLLVFFALLFLTQPVSSVYAQQSIGKTDPLSHFEHAKSLYYMDQYIPAMGEFEQFLELNSYPNLAFEAAVYVDLCRLQLGKQHAVQSLTRALKEHPEHKISGELNYEIGLYYFREAKYRRALRYLEDVNEVDVPANKRDELIFKKGYAFFQGDEYEKAKAEFAKILHNTGPYAVQANYYYGYQCYLLEDYECALRTFEKIGDKGPKTMRIYIAQIYYVRGQYTEAWDILDDLELASQKDAITLLQGKIKYQLEEYHIARDLFVQYEGAIQELKPDEIFQMAHTFYIQGDLERSGTYFTYIANEETGLGQAANYYMAVADLNNGNKNRAFNGFAEAKRKNADPQISELAAFNYAKLAAELEKNNIAVQSIQEFLKDYPRSEYNGEAQSIMANIYLRTKNYRAAIQVLEQIPNMDPATKKAYQLLTFHRAEELFLNSQYSEAETFFQKSLRHPVDRKLEAESYLWLGEIAFKQKDYAESIRHLNRFVSNAGAEQSALKPYAYYSLGYNYFRKDDYGKAQQYFGQYKRKQTFATSNKKVYLDNSLRLADCYFLNRQYEQAIEEYNITIQRNYKSADYALFQKGMLYGLLGKSDEKINTLKKIQQDFKQSVYVDQALFQIGDEYMSNEDYSMAESMFKLIISQHDDSRYLAESYLRLGLIYYNQNGDDKAMSYFKTVVERFPRSQEAQQALSYIEIIYKKQGRGEDWIAYARSVNVNISVDDQDSIIYESAMVKYRKGDCAGAVRDFKNYIQRFGNKGNFIIAVNYYKAECDFYNNRQDEALKHYKFVSEQSRNEFSEKANLKLADVYFKEQKFGESVTYYGRLEPQASNRTNFITALLGQMRCYYQMKDFERAKAKAIEILPLESVPKDNLVEAHMTLGRIQLHDENLQTARFHFDYVIKESRNALTAEAIYHTASIQFELDELEDARANVFKLNADFSAYEYWVVKGFILLSDIYVKEEDYFQAKATLQSILDNYSKEDDGILDICRMKLEAIKDKD